MLNDKPGWYWKICWKYLAPIFIIVVFFASVIGMMVNGISYQRWDVLKVESYCLESLVGVSKGLVQTSNFSCAEPNVNNPSSLFDYVLEMFWKLICVLFMFNGVTARKVRKQLVISLG
jgi:hypothetical protein